MKNSYGLFKRSAQTFVEYTLLVGVVIGLLIAMAPMLRRGTQGMIKIVSDQVGFQANAEQIGGTMGHLIETRTHTAIDRQRRTDEKFGNTTYQFLRDEVETQTSSFSNMGWSER